MPSFFMVSVLSSVFFMASVLLAGFAMLSVLPVVSGFAIVPDGLDILEPCGAIVCAMATGANAMHMAMVSGNAKVLVMMISSSETMGDRHPSLVIRGARRGGYVGAT